MGNWFLKSFVASILLCLHIDATNEINYIECIDQELPKLEVVFSKLFKENEFAYTLFFDKPVSFAFCYPTIIAPRVPIYSFHNQECVWKHSKAWVNGDGLISLEIFEQLLGQLPTTNFLLLTRDSSFGEDSGAVFFINKKAFIEVVNENLVTFQNVLGARVTAESLLHQIEQKEQGLFAILHEDHELLGIILGYGQANAREFKKQWACTMVIDAKERDQALEPYATTFISSIVPVTFVADNRLLETKVLRDKYRKQRALLSKLFQNEDWIEKILNQLFD